MGRLLSHYRLMVVNPFQEPFRVSGRVIPEKVSYYTSPQSQSGSIYIKLQERIELLHITKQVITHHYNLKEVVFILNYKR